MDRGSFRRLPPAIGASDLQMLQFFPEIYPEETVYSIVARLSRTMGQLGATTTKSWLFDAEKARIHPTVPANLMRIANAGPPSLTFEALHKNHSLADYYTAFQPPALATKVRLAAMERGSPANMAGAAMPFVSDIHRLKFCDVCRQEDRQAFGEAYWRRIHQLPEYLVCTRHHSTMQNTSIDFSKTLTKLYAAEDLSEYDIKPITKLTTRGFAIALRLSRLIEDVVSGERLGVCRNDLRASLNERARISGLTTRNNRFDRQAIREAAREAHADLEAVWPKIINDDGEPSWLRCFVSPYTKMHPFAIIMLIDAFNEVKNRPVEFQPSRITLGTGPWPCYNKLSDHYGESIVRNIHYSDYKWTRSLVILECDCGYVYTRAILKSGRITRPQMRYVGPLLREKVRPFLESYAELNFAAKSLGMTAKTLLHQLEHECVDHHWYDERGPTRKPKKVDRKRKGQRRLQDYQKRSAEATAKRDAQFAKAVADVVSDLLSKRPEVRLSIRQITKGVGLSCQTKLPNYKQTSELVLNHVETGDEFRLRKLHNIYRERDLSQLSLSAIAGMLGLRDPEVYSKFIREGLAAVGYKI